ncbi:MAG: tetratricopeptide repeat protein [Gammaproteobacteria bacterium]|nr:tetratricopeptide repeat protein [Gammaproteobacteria bacterium]
MSLINKMLLDLEARQPSPAPAAAAAPIYQDLHAANSLLPPLPSRVRMRFILALFSAVAAALCVWMELLPVSSYFPVPATSDMHPAEQTEAFSVTREPPEITLSLRNETASPSSTQAIDTQTPQANIDSASPPAEQVEPPALSIPAIAATTPRVYVKPVTIIKTPRNITGTEQAQTAYRDGQRRYAEQNYPEAEQQFRLALDFDAQHRPARAQLAALLLASGRSAEAQSILEQGATLVPEHAEFALMLARIQVERGQETEALAMLEHASARTNANVDISAFIAALHQRAGRHAEAAQRYQQALSVRPHEGRWWVGLAISLEAQQDWPAARDAYLRAINNTQLTPELIRYAEQRLAALRGSR